MAATHGKQGNVYKWNGTAANLTDEATTTSGNNAQVTDAAKRLLNPNADIAISGQTAGVGLKGIDWVSGTAKFDDAPGAGVLVNGTNAYIASANLIAVGYLYEWEMNVTLKTDETSAFQDDWDSHIVGRGGASGSAGGYFAGSNWFDDLVEMATGTKQYFYIDFYSYDPDDDGTGDHWGAWVIIPTFSIGANINTVVKETINFLVHGAMKFVANV